MSERRVLCISAGLLSPKKAGNPVARDHLYLNYGLLGLASLLHRQGYAARVFHGKFVDPEVFIDDLERSGWLATEHPILLSIPSCFALGWAKRTGALIKQRAPAAKVIVGGRWVVANDGAWVRKQLPDVDLVVYQTAESRIGALMDTTRWGFIQGTDRNNAEVGPTDNELPALNYNLLDDHASYHPSVEVSRGCGMGCVYCAEANVERGGMKPATQVADELAACVATYRESTFNPYFESSYFRPTTQWTAEIGRELTRREIRLGWRTETRVDALTPKQVSHLAQAGLKVLDLGLESASASQLLAMEKTNDPAVYLARAENLLRACADNGVWAKVNLLLFPGETRATVAESTEWLDRNRSLIKGMSASPTIVYRYGPSTSSYLEKLSDRGASAVDPTSLDLEGHTNLHLSSEIDHAAAVEICRSVSRTFMTAKDYFDLKAFSYLPRGFGWDDFMSRLAGTDKAQLSFSMS